MHLIRSHNVYLFDQQKFKSITLQYIPQASDSWSRINLVKTNAHATSLVTYLKSQGITTPETVKQGWDHVGGIIIDAVLQARRNYANVVRPRVTSFINSYPEASTTSGFLSLIKHQDLKDLIQFQSDNRATIAHEIATCFSNRELETAADIRACVQLHDEKVDLMKDLRRIRGVGPKTTNYIGVLIGDPDSFAIDSRIFRVLTAAGLPDLNYRQAEEVVRETAAILGWSVGALDATLWKLGEKK